MPTGDKEIAVLTRSMLEILAEASAGVDVPMRMARKVEPQANHVEGGGGR
ncbi:MAG: hypothetical protein U0V70_03695 [Terriglobia bacterium]